MNKGAILKKMKEIKQKRISQKKKLKKETGYGEKMENCTM